ncbi:hypothetical protein [Maridesulfovibrio hydrothermalis]|uniref:Elp3/MiaA/NifB-like radical SAM core domain-containing protein n=1 Tax=Maridesulfovibrio hydrothermalis AM13 = DSM 14728 TaxID=1121451 RepID=L0R9M5_9BACT|nr:hypothetical protein [Maridesulfovibrio hydrothermalis]CCO22296.1 protein of unknown function [Maridesulfovibrio hydrothermalis AM13 = DSM 14728]
MTTEGLSINSPVTQLLSYIGIESRRNGYQYWKDNQYAMHDCTCMGESWGFVWFRTSGCIQERRGSCIYCKYGTGPFFNDEQIIDGFKAALSGITKNYDFLFASSSGSLLDIREVSQDVYLNYLELLSLTDHNSFGFETRCETISSERIRQTQEKLGGRLRQVFMGLEIANESILKYCLNKQQNLDRFAGAIKILANEGVSSCVNVLVGIPFYSIEERIQLSFESVKWAFDNEAYRVFLFPINVKDHTPLSFLFGSKLYSPPSLWEMIEVMKLFPDKIDEKKIGISWYRPHKDVPGIIHSPITCRKCNADVLNLLDKYDKNPQFSYIQQLSNIECSCKNKWNEDKSALKCFSVDYLMESYQELSKRWDKTNSYYIANHESIRNELKAMEKKLKGYK